MLGSNRPHIVVLDDYERSAEQYLDWAMIRQQASVSLHQEPLVGERLIVALKTADVVILIRDRTPFTKALIDQLPMLKYVVFTGGRNNLIDMNALNARSIPVSHTEFGPSKEATAELTIALLMATMKRLDLVLQTAGKVNQAGTQSWRPGNVDGQFVMPRLLNGATLGLVGLGSIGTKVAEVAKALGMNVQTWSPNMTQERAASHGVNYAPLDELFATSDAISLHLVLAATTKHIVNAKCLAQMKPTAVLINTSRSGLVDEVALANALTNRQLASAATDVFDVEPVPFGYPLVQAPNLITTPHLGFVCDPVYRNFWVGVDQAITAWLAGQPLPRPYRPT
jgi:phosphoglycerate dehydrogenase-like enzyme